MSKIFTQGFGLGKEFSEDLIGTIQKLHEIGFDGIEPFVIFNEKQGKLPKNLWTLETFAEAKKEMDRLGMEIPSVHMGVAFGCFSMPVSSIAKNVEMLHDTYGVTDYVVSGTFGTVKQAKQWAKKVQKISDAIAPFGCRLLYHNHDSEFGKITYQGKTTDAMELFLSLAGNDKRLQLDIGWAGVADDEEKILEKYKDRVVSLHLKDFYKDYRDKGYTSRTMPLEGFSPIGEGAIRTEEILKQRDILSAFEGNIIIDQDKMDGDMLQSLKTGYNNIAGMIQKGGR